jgi:hypothetical protein
MIERKGDGLPIEKPTLDAAPNFAALGSLAAEVDAQAHEALNPGAAQAAADAAANGPDYAKGAAGIVELVSAMLDGYAPGAGWQEAQRTQMAASIAPVLEKYGWDLNTAMPCELVALMVCGPALYQSAKVVALKIQTDRLALARAARGLNDPNTIGGERSATGAMHSSAAAPAGVGDMTSADALGAALGGVPQFPDM